MSKKTVKRHYRKHRISNKKKRTYRKRAKRIYKGTGKGVQIFTKPIKMRSQSISVTPIQSGNMIPGLREM
jgi:hypothetical protein